MAAGGQLIGTIPEFFVNSDDWNVYYERLEQFFEERTFEALCELLRKQYSPQVAVFRERTTFYNARQEEGETVTVWYGRLKKLSVDCRFGENLEAVLLDKFVTGLRSGMIMDRLCEENEGLTLELALELAVNKECALKSEVAGAGGF
uniref:Retrotransposon gag domain-containing protein n=1 Tax=Anopheles farauti TaxID=69004 RepID=A0A182QJV4_9DIPT